MHFFTAAAFLLLLISTEVIAQTQPAGSKDSAGVESLGSELLNDLAPNAFGPRISRETQEPNRAPNRPSGPEHQTPRFDDLGSDIGTPSGPLALARVQQGMQQAASLLSNSESAADISNLQKSGEAQTQVIAQLDQLIAELSKQCKGGNCKPAAGAQPSARQSAQNKPAGSASAATRAQSAAQDSTSRLGEANAQPAMANELEPSVERLWGHLPERTRQQILQSFSDEFLPQYELEIEQYYRRLSEEGEIRQQE